MAVDVFNARKRSEVMSLIRGKGNKSTELALAKAFRKAGIKGWRRHVVIKSRTSTEMSISTRPDFVFRKERLAVFVDGCFWHRCPLHSKLPANNPVFWKQKLAGNVQRDRRANRELKKAGWRVVRVWEHDLVNATPAVTRIRRLLQRPLRTTTL